MSMALQPLKTPAGTAEAQFAVVAVRSGRLRVVADAVLREAGLTPLHVGDEYEAIQAVQNVDSVLGVVDAAMLGSATPDQFRRLRQDPSVAALPVILLSGESLPDIDAMMALGITQFVAGQVQGPDLAFRVALILAGSRATRRRKVAAASLRESTRAISAGLRATNDPARMADLVAEGLGEAFSACHVRIETFADERVPGLMALWSRVPGLTDMPPLSRYEAQEIAAGLWERESVLRVEDHSSPDETGEPLLPGAAGAGLRTSVFAPLVHGDQVLGYVWIAGTLAPRHWTRTELALIQHVCGNLAHGLLQGHLITAQREVLNRLRELDQAKTDFVATVNHELRTPLTSITGYLELIQDAFQGEIPAQMENMLEIVGRNATRLNQLISDLLTISRSDSPAPALTMEELDLAGILASVLAALAPAAAANGITLKLADAGVELVVNGDKAQLEQVFTNLVSNAVKFTVPGGWVQIRADSISTGVGTRIRVSVQDNGIGIPAGDVPHLFTRFFRASNATAAAIPGTGLGLAIVKDIVLQHGGELDIDSAVGRGTTVTVQIPAR